MTGKTKICPFCQNEFVTDKNAQVYCSERCRRGMFAKKKREQNKHYILLKQIDSFFHLDHS